MIGGTLKYLRAPLERNIEAGARVLVVTDTRHDPRVWQAVQTILADIGADATVAIFEPRPADYYDPPGPVVDALMRSDANILLASTGMLHSQASFNAMEAGIPSICMDGGMTLEMFQSGAVTEDWAAIARMKHYVATEVFGPDARECRVTSAFGSDLTYRVDDRIFVPPLPGPDFDGHKVIKFDEAEGRKGGNLFYFLNPTGEFNVPPIEGSANGKLVIDLTMHHLGRLQSPIELTVVEGRVVDIAGGADARVLRDYLETYGDENAYMCPAEASVGVNRRAIVRGIQREDKNILGAMHFGLGTNVDVGGSIRSKIHMDGVVLEPTLYVDGEKRIENGKFLVDIHADDDELVTATADLDGGVRT
jgi:2,5-dihydroxypyridine 5,6-dioxygenase